MAKSEYLGILKQGVEVWNTWRDENRNIEPDLYRAELSGADVSNANFSKTNLREASLQGANFYMADLRACHLYQTNLSGANLSRAKLDHANLNWANLWLANCSHAHFVQADLFHASLYKTNFTRAHLQKANLSMADLISANLTDTKLMGANLSGANLSKADLIRTDLTNCSIHGLSAWDVHLEDAVQLNLILTDEGEPVLRADNIEVAQFIYLLLHNTKIRQVIDTITSKVVLLLGRFTPERKKILDALRDQLRSSNYSPVVFNFEKPGSRDFTETMSTLAHLSKFIIADLTDPSSIPQELQAIVPDLAVPVQPLLEESKREYAIFVDFHKYHWVLPTYIYKDQSTLLAALQTEIIDQAEKKVAELMREKAEAYSREKR